jgi:hypothetical protein
MPAPRTCSECRFFHAHPTEREPDGTPLGVCKAHAPVLPGHNYYFTMDEPWPLVHGTREPCGDGQR